MIGPILCAASPALFETTSSGGGGAREDSVTESDRKHYEDHICNHTECVKPYGLVARPTTLKFRRIEIVVIVTCLLFLRFQRKYQKEPRY